MEIKKILWTTDFSGNAAKALPYVTALAETYRSEIHILYVLKNYAVGSAYGETVPEADYERMRRWERETAEKRLDEICGSYLNSCPLYVRHIGVGDPAREILKLMKEQEIDMVVIASRGTEGHFDFGSVAERVLRGASVPVLMIPV